MWIIDAEEICALAPLPRIIDCLQDAFRGSYVTPARQVLRMPGEGGERLLLCMPAFNPQGGATVKLSTLSPENPAVGLPVIQAAIIVFSRSGTPVAMLDGTAVTRLRTAAASALASRYLSRPDSAHLAIIGTGALAPTMAQAHCAVRPIRTVSIWGRSPERVAKTATAIRGLLAEHVEVRIARSAEESVATADVVSCATSSPTPLIRGSWLRPGTFVDAVGSFSPSKRETDDDVVLRARIFVDTIEGALAEAGDILDPLARGVIDRGRLEGELADLVSGRMKGRGHPQEITLFKSVGTALEDLAVSEFLLAAAAQRAVAS